MSEIHMIHYSFGGESPDRSRIHEIALREARIATDYHELAPTNPARAGFISRLGLGSRLRVAFSGGPATTEPCNCPA